MTENRDRSHIIMVKSRFASPTELTNPLQEAIRKDSGQPHLRFSRGLENVSAATSLGSMPLLQFVKTTPDRIID